MRIRVHLTGADVAAVHVQPSRLARWLLGRVERDLVAISVPSLAGGRIWIDDYTGRRITDAAVIAALDRERDRLDRAPTTALQQQG